MELSAIFLELQRSYRQTEQDEFTESFESNLLSLSNSSVFISFAENYGYVSFRETYHEKWK